MRLLNIHSLRFEDFHDGNLPRYAITSHRWTDDEATYKDVKKKRNTESKGYKKIEGFCSFVKRTDESLSWSLSSHMPIEWIWIDTCCINSESSAEVSESINSMAKWYSRAAICFAYLADVRSKRNGGDILMNDFRQNEWFERGWTLQELLIPPSVVFLTQDWEVIGNKSYYLSQIIASTRVTGIPREVLLDFSNSKYYSIAEKMGWAARRRTTKPEDMAYCLLGIFDVHMPLIYGEGEDNARARLEQEISRRPLQEVEPAAPPAPPGRTGEGRGNVIERRLRSWAKDPEHEEKTNVRQRKFQPWAKDPEYQG